MARHQHGSALVGQHTEQLTHPAHPRRVQSVRRLVQHHDSGVAEQGGGEPETLTHAERIAADPAIGRAGEPGDIEQRTDASLVEASGAGDHAQMVTAGARWVEPGRLEHATHLAARRGQLAICVTADERGA